MNLSKISKFLLYLVPFTVVLVYSGTLFPFIVAKYTFFRIVVELALIFFIWAWARGEIKASDIRSRLLNSLALGTALFVAIFIVAGIFGYYPHGSFWSNYERGEGGFQMLHLLAYFLMLVVIFKDKTSWRRLFIVSLWASGLLIAYGLLAAAGAGGFYGSDLCQRFAGSLGNPAYAGTYMIFSIFYSLYLSFGESKRSKRWLFLSVALLMFVALLFTQTRGALLGLGVGIIAALAYVFFKLKEKKKKILVAVSIVGLIAAGSLGIVFRRHIDLLPFCQQGGNRILDVSFGAETYQTRLILWQKSVEMFKEKPLLGWGPENFYPGVAKYNDYRLTAWFDRAHNVFFDYLTMTGILGFLSYLWLFVAYYILFFKKKKEDSNLLPAIGIWQYALLFAIPIAYLIQGMVLFDVLSIYINLFIVLAFGIYVFAGKPNEFKSITKD